MRLMLNTSTRKRRILWPISVYRMIKVDNRESVGNRAFRRQDDELDSISVLGEVSKRARVDKIGTKIQTPEGR